MVLHCVYLLCIYINWSFSISVPISGSVACWILINIIIIIIIINQLS